MILACLTPVWISTDASGYFVLPLSCSVGQILLESFAARLGIQLKEDRNTISWIGEKEVEVYPPKPKGNQKSKKRPKRDPGNSNELVAVEPLAAPVIEEPIQPYRVNVVLVKPSQYQRQLLNMIDDLRVPFYTAQNSS